jgi:ubiquinone/menaquinone biosynthesis C-methylase UbiE
MSEFDQKARDWDNNPIHWERSEAIARSLLCMVPINKQMKALEFGAGTGILSFILADRLAEISLMDNSKEMVRVMHEKVQKAGLTHLFPLFFDLENTNFNDKKFDLIFSQMALHHVSDVDLVLTKFYSMLNDNGILAIADLHSEDGSFHGVDAKVHMGFDPYQLEQQLKNKGFFSVKFQDCYSIKRDNNKEYPIFLIIAHK